MAAGAAGTRQRPERVAEGRAALPPPERLAVPLGRPARADEPEVRAGVRRGEDVRLGDECGPERRPDAHGPLLGGEPAADVDPRLPDDLRPAGAVARGQRTALRDALPDRRRRADRRLE